MVKCHGRVLCLVLFCGMRLPLTCLCFESEILNSIQTSFVYLFRQSMPHLIGNSHDFSSQTFLSPHEFSHNSRKMPCLRKLASETRSLTARCFNTLTGCWLTPLIDIQAALVHLHLTRLIPFLILYPSSHISSGGPVNGCIY